jgi:ComF family protein
MKLYLFIKQTKNFLLDILFPIKCIGCNIKDKILCDICISKIRLAERETDKNIIALFDYRDLIIKKVIWELKYHHKRYLGEKLGQLLYESVVEEVSDMRMYISGRSIYVIPVPISNKKTKLRGYNQTLVIAKGFCNQTDKNILELKNNIVFKKVDTLAQAKITNRKRRLENIHGVFEIKNKEIVKGRTIIVIDDVTTTGGTINEMIKVLRKAGARSIIGFAVAH